MLTAFSRLQMAEASGKHLGEKGQKARLPMQARPDHPPGQKGTAKRPRLPQLCDQMVLAGV